MKIRHVTLLVKDQNEALNFYVEKLGFQKCQGTTVEENMRWITVSPKDQPDVELTFVKADSKINCKTLGRQAGNHVFLTCRQMIAAKITK